MDPYPKITVIFIFEYWWNLVDFQGLSPLESACEKHRLKPLV